ncbi:hypothetical protein RchiOBHm_Chr5g0030491 [Rosa chinensis]|uniref:Uncharacterized protein n=1 Tax=Rosa chinensis TaxID=74649 RepID=A0A2P6Q9X0_ROSCH|nr:hypothetical protein RchiOBHm_Chr5g0030491 [Rosa chinensis]
MSNKKPILPQLQWINMHCFRYGEPDLAVSLLYALLLRKPRPDHPTMMPKSKTLTTVLCLPLRLLSHSLNTPTLPPVTTNPYLKPYTQTPLYHLILAALKRFGFVCNLGVYLQWLMELLELLLLILNLCLVLCPTCGILVINCVVGILFGLQEFGFWYTWFTVCAFICRCEKIYLSLDIKFSVEFSACSILLPIKQLNITNHLKLRYKNPGFNYTVRSRLPCLSSWKNPV